MSDQRKPPLCDQPKWNHIRHRCCCVFDYDSDSDEPLAECNYHLDLRRELAEARGLLREARERAVADCLHGSCPLNDPVKAGRACTCERFHFCERIDAALASDQPGAIIKEQA
jgi:hypothetical protein